MQGDAHLAPSLRLRLAWALLLTLMVTLLAITHQGPTGDIPERHLDTATAEG